MTTVTFSFNPRKLLSFVVPIAVLAGLTLGFVKGRRVYYEHKLSEAARLFQSGYAALALEAIDANIEHFVHDARGCAITIQIYNANQRLDRLHWVVDSCRYSNVDTPEVLQASAIVQKESGDLKGALFTLRVVTEKFPNLPMPYFNLALILRQANHPREAAEAVDKGVAHADNNPDLYSMAMENYVALGEKSKAISLLSLVEALTHKQGQDPRFRMALVAFTQTWKANLGLMATNVPPQH